MKDTHLIIALYRALDRYGSSSMPEDDATRTERGRHGPWHQERRRSPGWVSVAEIEACQSPNTYPRLTRRTIRARCEALATEESSPVRGIDKRPGGLRTWVLVVPPGDEAGGPPSDAGEDAREAPGPATTGEDPEDATPSPGGAAPGRTWAARS